MVNSVDLKLCSQQQPIDCSRDGPSPCTLENDAVVTVSSYSGTFQRLTSPDILFWGHVEDINRLLVPQKRDICLIYSSNNVFFLKSHVAVKLATLQKWVDSTVEIPHFDAFAFTLHLVIGSFDSLLPIHHPTLTPSVHVPSIRYPIPTSFAADSAPQFTARDVGAGAGVRPSHASSSYVVFTHSVNNTNT
ncbi:hypothetical protein EVAR_31043_1 [Eumeta japonica]|uniref:Uncharacterized protein n=1 Tax=Eumeta variegata TaxID=151549 RepID=A0A4C1VH29_EUMVA|nr:hypothetical protein EVAR_31043_1 [Eumeta japonica]